MALIPPSAPGKVLYWLPNSTLGSARVDDLLDLIASAVATDPAVQKYYLDTSYLGVVLAAVTGTGSLGAVSVAAPVTGSASLAAVSGSGSLGAVAVAAGASATTSLAAVSGTGSLGTITAEPAAAGIALVAAVSGTGAGSNITLPAGRAAGDILVIVTSSNGGITNYTTKTPNDGNLAVFWRRATNNSSDNANITATVEYVCACYRGCVATGDPFEAISSSVASGDTTGASLTIPQITSTTNGAWILAAASGVDGGWDDGEGGVGLNSGPTWATPTGAATTEDGKHVGTADPATIGAALHHSLKATAGATGSEVVRFYMTGYAAGSGGTLTLGVLLALKPA